ncbi:hypothetical protein, partial [Muriicola sp.]|uniref:hypothetical protein n=1 Tax=Muriicola sp. TaxID=2020856 RepID=UPI003C72C028
HKGGMTFIWALFVERRKPLVDVKGKQQAGRFCKPITNAAKGDGSVHISEEGFVMELELE